MQQEPRRALFGQRTITAVLAVLVVFDAFLVISVAAAPGVWFELFHETADESAGALLFLRRCAANWAAFFLLQLGALAAWRRRAGWLAVTAGVRGSDIFTDISYAVLADEPTTLALVSLPLMGAVNLGLALYFWFAYRHWNPR